MKYLLLIFILILSCNFSKKGSDQNYEKSCIIFEHVGEEDIFYPVTIMSINTSSYEFKFDSPLDSLDSNLQILDSLTYNKLRNYILDNIIVYDSNYIQNEVFCSGYEVSLKEDDKILTKYFILEKDDYYQYFNGLIDEVNTESKSGAELVESIGKYFSESDFYCKER